MHTTKSHIEPRHSSRSPSEFTGETSVMRAIAFWLSLILVFMIPWEDAVDIAGLGTLTRGIGLLVAAFWGLTVVATERFRKPHPFHVAVYLFVLWNVISYFWSMDVDRTVSRIMTYFQLAAMVYILWDLYTTPAALKAGLQAYVLGAYVAIGSTIFNYLTGIEESTFRYAATGFDANDLGLILALGIPVAWYLVVSECNNKFTRVLRLVNYAYIPAALFAILLTASRGGLIATIPSFLFILGTFTQVKLSYRVLIFGALVVTLFALQPLVPKTSFERLATTGTSIIEGDMSGRLDIWRDGIAIFLEHPLLGIGSDAFRVAVESGKKVTHNSFLSVLVEVGMVGFILFAATLTIVFYQALRQPKLDSRLWLSILLIWAIGAFALTWEHRKPTWLFLGMVVISAGLSMRRDESVTQIVRQTQKS